MYLFVIIVIIIIIIIIFFFWKNMHRLNIRPVTCIQVNRKKIDFILIV